jgi:prophage regulatory protein
MMVISYKDLAKSKGIRFSRQWISKMVNDGKFPTPIKIGQRATGFIEAEVDAWLNARAAERGAKTEVL